MKMLIYGSGVVGTFYAAKLAMSGHQITVLARGKRLADIRRGGLVLEDAVHGGRSRISVNIVERLTPEDWYDLALVTVRRDQLTSILPDLAANKAVSTYLFMLNNPVGTPDIVELLGQDRVLLGFPGVGGVRNGQVVNYAVIAQQPTTLGELNGERTHRLLEIVRAFRAAGIPTRISRHMDAWLKVHAFFVTAICGAIYLKDGNCSQLSEDRSALERMIEGVREGFAAIRALGLPIVPVSLRALFNGLPKFIAIRYWRTFFGSPIADLVFGRHADYAAQEMREIAHDCRRLLKKSRISAPALLSLYQAIDAKAG